MKQPKLWRRWFAKRTERIEITHETNTLIVMRASRSLTPVDCPECGSDLHSHNGANSEALICHALVLTQTSGEKTGNPEKRLARRDEPGSCNDESTTIEHSW
jgi:hypothetical protein